MKTDDMSAESGDRDAEVVLETRASNIKKAKAAFKKILGHEPREDEHGRLSVSFVHLGEKFHLPPVQIGYTIDTSGEGEISISCSPQFSGIPEEDRDKIRQDLHQLSLALANQMGYSEYLLGEQNNWYACGGRKKVPDGNLTRELNLMKEALGVEKAEE